MKFIKTLESVYQYQNPISIKKKTPTDIHWCICNTLKREGYTNITLRTFTQVNDAAYYIDITFLFKDKKQRIVRSENAGFTEEVNLLEIIET